MGRDSTVVGVHGRINRYSPLSAATAIAAGGLALDDPEIGEHLRTAVTRGASALTEEQRLDLEGAAFDYRRAPETGRALLWLSRL